MMNENENLISKFRLHQNDILSFLLLFYNDNNCKTDIILDILHKVYTYTLDFSSFGFTANQLCVTIQFAFLWKGE